MAALSPCKIRHSYAGQPAKADSPARPLGRPRAGSEGTLEKMGGVTVADAHHILVDATTSAHLPLPVVLGRSARSCDFVIANNPRAAGVDTGIGRSRRQKT